MNSAIEGTDVPEYTIALHELLQLSFDPPEPGAGCAVVTMPVGPQSHGFTENLHGGAIATAIDVACALAAVSATDFDLETQTLVTVDMHVRYLGSPRTASVHARARVVKAGSTLIVVDCQVVDDEDHLVAHADFSMMIVDRR